MLRVVGFIALTLCTMPEAHASGSWYEREPMMTTLRPCSGKLVEKIVFESAITSLGDDYLLACIDRGTHASWVFQAGMHCDSTISNFWCKNAAYSDLKTHQGMQNPSIAMQANNVYYVFTKYAIGENCNVKGPMNGDETEWVCDDVTISIERDLHFKTGSSDSFHNIDQDENLRKWDYSFRNTATITCEVGYAGYADHPLINCSGLDRIMK